MQYDFDELIDRRGTNATKYAMGNAINPYLPKNYIPMWLADMEFATPDPILDAIHKRVDRRILGYSNIADPAYYRAVTNWFQRRFDWTVDPDAIVHSSGVVTAINACVEHLTASREGVILFTPSYKPFDTATKRYGRKPVYCQLKNNDGYYSVDYEDLEIKAQSPKNTLLFLCSPHNPTGRVWSAMELARIGDICFRNNVFIVSDEIHQDLLREGVEHLPLAKLFPNENRLITCTAPSKTFNMAGMQQSNLIIPDPAIRSEWESMAYLGHPSPLGIEACRAAYTKCENWLTHLLRYLDNNFRYMHEYLSERLPQARMRIPEGTYLAWVDLSSYRLSDEELKRRISEAGVFVQFAEDFVDNGQGHIRVNVACPRLMLEWALQKICNALSED